MHLFSVLFEAPTVDGELRTVEGLEKAVEWCRDSGLGKVFVESYRDGIFVDEELLARVRDRFLREGFAVCGCVTTTKLPRNSNNWPDACCYSDAKTRERVREIFARTASVFDVIIIDDFFFTDCTCELCEASRGSMNFDDYHCDIMHKVAVEDVLPTVRRINPECKVIIKYPLWYEDYHKNGYDVIRQTQVFDMTWAGTETREPDAKAWGRNPQTNAFFVMEWQNKLGQGKCKGGWYDTLSTTPATYLDQARQTVLGHAKETMLYSYQFLTLQQGVPSEPDYTPGIENTEALRKERPALDKLQAIVESKRTVGVSVPKQPHSDAAVERYLGSFYGLIGIPVDPDTELNPCAPAVILGMQAAGYPGIREYVRGMQAAGRPVAVTAGFENETGIGGDCVIDITENYKGREGFDPKDNWNILDLPEQLLNEIRDKLTEPFGLIFRGPVNVGLNLYGNDTEVIQNFRNEDVEVTLDLYGRDPAERQVLLTLSDDKKVTIIRKGSRYTLNILARTYAVLGTTGTV
ncbi:MAG: hypothetical protein IJU57_03730 [Clostridia bacterium]|nr:hypothetical protein [Clostridia bacterium]